MRRHTIRLWLILALSLVLCGCGDSKSILIVHNGTVIISDGSLPIQDGLIAIQGNQILFVGPESEYEIPRGAEVYDVKGGTILPGFIDSHTHSTSDPAVRREFLINGVTTVCDLGSPINELFDFKITSDGDKLAARGIAAGPIVTAPGGLPGAVMELTLNHEVATPEEGRSAVEDLIQQGAGLIKVYLQNESNESIYPMLDQETLEAIVEEAHHQGVPVRAHVTYIPLLEMAVVAGVDVVEHIPINVPSALMDEAGQERRNQMLQSEDPLETFFLNFPEYTDQLEEMVENGVILIPTLERPFGDLFRAADQDPQLAAVKKIILGIVGRFHEQGGEVGMGTDFNINIGMAKGIPLGELEMLIEAGLNPLEVIEASTRIAAEACGVGDELGTLETGKIADLIVVRGNPLDDLEVLTEIVLVIKDGQLGFRDQ